MRRAITNFRKEKVGSTSGIANHCDWERIVGDAEIWRAPPILAESVPHSRHPDRLHGERVAKVRIGGTQAVR